MRELAGGSQNLPNIKRRALREREKMRRLLGDWYGTSQGNLEVARYDEQVDLSEACDRAMKAVLSPDLRRQFLLAEHWQEIAGRQLALLFQFSSYSKGVLTLEVRHSALLSEKCGQEDALLERANALLQENCCKELRLVPAGRAK